MKHNIATILWVFFGIFVVSIFASIGYHAGKYQSEEKIVNTVMYVSENLENCLGRGGNYYIYAKYDEKPEEYSERCMIEEVIDYKS